jgi:hypothetical protein
MITYQEVNHLMPLIAPPGTISYLNKLERAFFGRPKDKT